MSRSYRRTRKPRKSFGRKQYRRSDRHHIVARAIGGDNSPENVIIIDRRIHELIHQLFGTLHPKEYLPHIKRNPSVAIYKLIRGVVRTFGTGIVEAALKDATT